MSVRGQASLPRLADGGIDNWPVTFSGTEPDYARIWLRGAMLTVLSLGFFLPWARIACRRYLMQHTHVAGFTLDDRRSPRELLVRQCLGLSLIASVALAAMGSHVVGLLVATLVLAVWPMLHLVGLSDLIGQTTWGRRTLSFDAPLSALYQVWGMPVMGLSALVWSGLAVTRVAHPVAWMLWGMAMGLWLLSLPTLYWGCLHLRQTHLRLGPIRLRWRLGPDSVSALLLTTLVSALPVLMLNLGVLSMCLGGWLWWHASGGRSLGSLAGWASVCLGLCVLTALWAVLPEAQVRMHKLVWNRTGDRHVRVRCRLPVPVWVRMRRRHALLLLLTLGLYWPWATVQARRMCLRATVLQSRVGLSVLAAHWPVK